MKAITFWVIGLVWGYSLGLGSAQSNAPTRARRARPVSGQMVSVYTTNHIGLVTNGPAKLRADQIVHSWSNPAPVLSPYMVTNEYFVKMRESKYAWTNMVFESFRPESLNQAIWTNFIANTNGRTVQIWSERTHPSG